MVTPDTSGLWSAVVDTAGLSIPEQQRESFHALATGIQDLMGTLRVPDLGETPPGFAFRAQ